MCVLVKLVVSIGAIAVVGSGAVVATQSSSPEPDSAPRKSALRVEVIDGDTVRLPSGPRVRLIGINAPEHGECGGKAATAQLEALVDGRDVALRNPESVQDTDRYGRLLRYLEVVGGVDTGYALVKAGLAQPRYDSRDGYDPHPRESRYHRSDQAVISRCLQGEKRE